MNIVKVSKKNAKCTLDGDFNRSFEQMREEARREREAEQRQTQKSK